MSFVRAIQNWVSIAAPSDGWLVPRTVVTERGQVSRIWMHTYSRIERFTVG